MTNIDRMLDQTGPYVSPEEVAEKLRVTARTVRNLCERGEIDGARKVGRQWRIPASYLLPEPA